MTQRLMTAQEYIDWTDMLAQAIGVLLTAKGVEATPATAAHYAADFRNAVTGLDQPDEARVTADFIDAAIALVEAVERESEVQTYFSRFNGAVTSHLGSDVNTLLSNAGLRAHHLWKRSGNVNVLPANVFPPVTLMGVFTATGAGTGTWTEDAESEGEIDRAKYGAAALEVRVINQQLGASQIVLTVVGTDANGAAQSHTATITSEAAQDAVFDVGNGTTDRYATVTSATSTGGTNGDDLQVQSKEDRTL